MDVLIYIVHPYARCVNSLLPIILSDTIVAGVKHSDVDKIDAHSGLITGAGVLTSFIHNLRLIIKPFA